MKVTIKSSDKLQKFKNMPAIVISSDNDGDFTVDGTGKNFLIKLIYSEKYNNYVRISFIFDKKMITQYKASPIDEGPDKFLQLFKERIIL